MSACLFGLHCTYLGNANSSWEDGYNRLIPCAQAAGIELVPVCPEILGGLPTPRPPAEAQGRADQILQGKGAVRNAAGQDVTAEFVRGAYETLLLAQRFDVSVALLMSRSPSCGKGKVYSGNFDRVLIDGNGLTTELLQENGIRVYSSAEYLTLWKQTEDFRLLFS